MPEKSNCHTWLSELHNIIPLLCKNTNRLRKTWCLWLSEMNDYGKYHSLSTKTGTHLARLLSYCLDSKFNSATFGVTISTGTLNNLSVPLFLQQDWSAKFVVSTEEQWIEPFSSPSRRLPCSAPLSQLSALPASPLSSSFPITISSFNKCSLNSHYVPDTLLWPGITLMKKYCHYLILLSFYYFSFTSICFALQILHFSQIEYVWQPCIKQLCWYHFPNSICTLPVSVSLFGNCCNILNFFIIIYLLWWSVISDLWCHYCKRLKPTEGSDDG